MQYSVSHRFSYALIGVVTVMLVVFSVVAILANLNRIRSQLEQSLVHDLKIAEMSLGTAVWNVDNEALDDFLEAIFANENIVYARIFAADETFSTRVRPDFEQKDFVFFEQSPQFLAKSTDILYREEKVGTMQLVMSWESVQQELLRSIVSILALMVLIVVSIAITSILITRCYIARPLSRLQDSTAAMAQGDFEAFIDVKGRDESGRLARSLNDMRESLKKLLEAVQQSGIRVTASATQLAASGQQLQSMMTQQVAATREVEATSQEIAATSQQLVRTMDEVAELSEDTAKKAKYSQAGLSRMASTMLQMEQAANATVDKLAVIHKRAANISTVITTITKVADQTNLLSLNASIEAEKAGEYGAGFAVVAREIRRLADQAAVATLDIERIVDEMSTAVSEGRKGMDQFARAVSQGVEDVRTVGTELGHIIDQAQALAPRLDSVNQGVQSQSQGAQQISESMMQLSHAAQQTVDSLHASGQAIEQLNISAHSLREGITRFKVHAVTA